MAILRRRHDEVNPPENGEGPTSTSTVPKKPTLIPRLSLSLVYLLALIFLILVEIGSIGNKPVLRSIYFFKVDLANIVPQSVPNAMLINSIARTLGLHDFYQVGLWGFCEGYDSDPNGVTDCSKPVDLYWFDPVAILLNELLAGASISLPTEVTSALKLVRLASHWMFTCFLVGTILTFLCIFISPTVISSHPRYIHRGRRIFFRSLPLTILAFLALFFTTVGSLIATIMFVIFRNVIREYATDLNIEASLGTRMFAFMWTATGLDLIGFIWSIGNCCAVCCCSGKRKTRGKGLIVDSHGNSISRDNRPTTTTTASANAEKNDPKPPGNRKRFVWRSRRVAEA